MEDAIMEKWEIGDPLLKRNWQTTIEEGRVLEVRFPTTPNPGICNDYLVEELEVNEYSYIVQMAEEAGLINPPPSP